MKIISQAPRTCPAVRLLGVNYRLTGLSFVVLESGVRGSAMSNRHSRRLLSLTLNTLSKWSHTVLHSNKRPASMERSCVQEGGGDQSWSERPPTHCTFHWHLLWGSNYNNNNNGVKTDINPLNGRKRGGRKGFKKNGRNFHQYKKGSESKYNPLVITGTWNL